MRKDWLIFIVSGTITLVIALFVIRLFAPGLLGVPVDLQMVQVDKTLPPFYDGVFRDDTQKKGAIILQDPLSNIRARPLLKRGLLDGPHDILGFRNRFVPNVADIVFVGDSQTYGTNVTLGFDWPSIVARQLNHKQPSIYNMSVGGWSAIQYYYILKHAVKFSPRIIVVAFYSGNDALESFTLAYGSEIWKEFRVNPKLKKKDAPSVKFPPPEDDHWSVSFKDGTSTTFAPKLRLASNADDPAAKTGYEILANVAQKISLLANESNTSVVFTIIPTKELVYAQKIKLENISAPESYLKLIENEEKNMPPPQNLWVGVSKN